MPCLLALLALIAPRLVIILVAIFSTYFSTAYQHVLWPILGFFFMPFTTLAYAWAINSNGSVSGFYLVVVVIAVLMDLSALGGGYSQRTFVTRRA